MEEHGSKAINIGASLIVTLVIIGVVITIVTVAIKLANNSTSQISDQSAKLEESQYTKYDNQTVTGDQVASIIKQFEGNEISIVVDNGKGDVQYNYKSSGASADGAATLSDQITSAEESKLVLKAQNKTTFEGVSEAYITPTGRFQCKVCRDKDTQSITALYFKLVKTK